MSDINDLISDLKFSTFGMPKRQKRAVMAEAIRAWGNIQAAGQENLAGPSATVAAAKIHERGETTRQSMIDASKRAYTELLREQAFPGQKKKKAGAGVMQIYGDQIMNEGEPFTDEPITEPNYLSPGDQVSMIADDLRSGGSTAPKQTAIQRVMKALNFGGTEEEEEETKANRMRAGYSYDWAGRPYR